MKGMPVKDLKKILDIGGHSDSTIILQDTLASIMEAYGDDYYRDYGISDWELCEKNERRAAKLGGA